MDNITKIYNMNLKVGSKKETFKSDIEKAFFDIFDTNKKDGVLDSSEVKRYQTFRKNFFEISPEREAEMNFWRDTKKLYSDRDINPGTYMGRILEICERYPNIKISTGDNSITFKLKDQNRTITINNGKEVIETIDGLEFKYELENNKYLSTNFGFPINNKEKKYLFIYKFPADDYIPHPTGTGYVLGDFDLGSDIIYNKDGSILSIYRCDIAYNLYNDFSEKNFGIFPTTGKDLKNHMEQITPDNVIGVLHSYPERAEETLFESILDETDFNLPKEDKRKYLHHIFDCLTKKIPSLKNVANEFYNEVEIQLGNFISDSKKLDNLIYKEIQKVINECTPGTKIDNDNYIGKEYKVETVGSIVKITDPTNNKTVNVDLEKLCEDFEGDRIRLINMLKSLPAEVLLDINKFFKPGSNIFDNLFNKIFKASHCNPLTKKIYFNNGMPLSKETIVHELAHAMDFTSSGFPTSFWDNEEYNETYEREMAEFTKEHARYNPLTNKKGDLYATWNIWEMFAECYTLLMVGDSESKDVIETYFPDTLENVKLHLENIRRKY